MAGGARGGQLFRHARRSDAAGHHVPQPARRRAARSLEGGGIAAGASASRDGCNLQQQASQPVRHEARWRGPRDLRLHEHLQGRLSPAVDRLATATSRCGREVREWRQWRGASPHIAFYIRPLLLHLAGRDGRTCRANGARPPASRPPATGPDSAQRPPPLVSAESETRSKCVMGCPRRECNKCTVDEASGSRECRAHGACGAKSLSSSLSYSRAQATQGR